MDGAVDGGAVIGAAVAGMATLAALVAWRWWLADRTAERAHVAALHGRSVDTSQRALDALPGKMQALEERVRALEYRKT